MTIRAVVVDIGGVLEITPPSHWIEDWEARLHLAPGTFATQLADIWQAGALGHITEADVEQHIQARFGLSQAELTALFNDLWAAYLGTLNVELAEYLGSLRPRYRTAIISNSFVGAREREQQRYRFDSLFEFIIYSHEVGLEKPDRRIFELACERLGVTPAEVLFLDDTEMHVAAARELGMQAIHFETTAQAIAAIEACLQRSA